MGSDDPLKLLIAGAPLRPGWGGGEPVIARDLIVGLQSKGFEVVVLPTGRTMAQTAWMTMSPQDWDPYSYLQYAAKLDQIAPDCVLGFYDYDCSLLRAAVDRDIPFVASVHIYWPVCPIGTLYIDGLGNCSGPEMSRCLKHMSRSVPPTRLPLGLSWMPAPLGLSIYLKTRGRMAELKKASAIVVPSQRIREILESFGLANIKEVANGLVLEKIPAQPWTRGTKQVLFASGATSERKGFAHFLELARRVGPSDKNAVFAATSFSGSALVRGLGRLPYPDVLKAMRDSYVIVAPSLWEEPLSVTIQEAMASGKAVIAYDVGGTAELIGDAGVLVPRGDISALCSATRDLLADSGRVARLGIKARARAESMFRLERMVEGYVRILQSVV
ncbi:MAG: glycosyltransferase family 4 protein [Thermoplasmata archaeon]